MTQAEKKRTYNVDIRFDNAGGTLLMAAVEGVEYTHHYDDPRQAADAVLAIIAGDDIADWEGNEPEYADAYAPEASRTGGVMWVSLDDENESFDVSESRWLWGRNSQAFAETFHAHRTP